MTDELSPVVVQILDKEYRIACNEDEKEALREASRFLDEKMREIRKVGKVIGSDRIAVMAALNLAHDLLQHQERKETATLGLSRRLRSMQQRIDNVLTETNQLEL